MKKNESMIIKGVAILMMLCHHCFSKGQLEMYNVDFTPFKGYQIFNIASFFKICVSLFAFVSGYGLMESYTKKSESLSVWMRKHLVHMLSNYWFVVLGAWMISLLIDQRPIWRYEFSTSVIYGIFNMLIDGLGLGNLFNGKLFAGVWWYMSAAVTFIFMLPLLEILTRYFGCFYSLSMLFIVPRIFFGGYKGSNAVSSFLLVFYIGMMFSQKEIFFIWKNFWRLKCKKRYSLHILKFLGMLLMVGILYKLYYFLPTDKFWDVKWGLIPIGIILFIYDYIVCIPIIKDALLFIGKHSTNIFLVHPFVLYYYLGGLSTV